MVKRIFEEIDRLQQYVRIWEDVCNIESPSSCKEGVDRVGAYFLALARLQLRGLADQLACADGALRIAAIITEL